MCSMPMASMGYAASGGDVADGAGVATLPAVGATVGGVAVPGAPAVAGGGPASTTIVPCMFGWTVQWYGNVPAWVNVKLNDWPVVRLPESQTPLSLVDV